MDNEKVDLYKLLNENLFNYTSKITEKLFNLIWTFTNSFSGTKSDWRSKDEKLQGFWCLGAFLFGSFVFYANWFSLCISVPDLIVGLTTINYLRLVIWKYLWSY